MDGAGAAYCGSLSRRDIRNLILTQGLRDLQALVDAVVHELLKLRSLSIILNTNDIDRRSFQILLGLFSTTAQKINLEETERHDMHGVDFWDDHTHGPPTEMMSASK